MSKRTLSDRNTFTRESSLKVQCVGCKGRGEVSRGGPARVCPRCGGTGWYYRTTLGSLK